MIGQYDIEWRNALTDALYALNQPQRQQLIDRATASFRPPREPRRAPDADDWPGETEKPRSKKPTLYLTVPHRPPAARVTEVNVAAQAILDALLRLETAALAHPEGPLYRHLWNAVDPDGHFAMSLTRDPSLDSMRQRLRRIDGQVDHRTGIWMMLEANQIAPRGMVLHDEGLLVSTRVVNELGLEAPEPELVCPAIAEWLIKEYEQRHGAGMLPRCIAVSYDPDIDGIYEVLDAAERMADYLYLRYGERIKFIPAEAKDFVRWGNKMFAGGHEIDLIWCNTYRLDRPGIETYLEILNAPHDFLVVNHPSSSRLTRTKGALPAVIWDDDLVAELGLSPEQLALLRRHIPRTLHLKNGDNLKEVYQSSCDWYFKPSDGGMGIGAFPGIEIEPSLLWDYLNSERGSNYVAQRTVIPQKLELIQLEPGTGELTRHIFETDYSPYVIGGKLGSQRLMRAREVDGFGPLSQPLNLSTGDTPGWVVPVF